MQTNGKLQLYPLLRLAVAMALGVVVGYETYGTFSQEVWLVALVVSVSATAVAGRHDLLQGALMMTAFVFLGGFLVTRRQAQCDKPLPEGYVTYKAVVASQPQERGKTLRMDLWILDDEEMPRRVKASLLRDAYAQKSESLMADRLSAVDAQSMSDHLQVGDGIIVTSRMEKPENYYSSHFDYPLYLRCHGFTATTFIVPGSWRKAALDLGSLSRLERARLSALRFRQHTLRRYLSLGLDDDEMAVAVAMALGDKSRLTNDLRDIYSVSGASHVLALSGLHLGIIYMLLSLMVGMRRLGWLREVFIIAGIWSYALFTGLSPSVVRASTMITVYALVGLLGRDRMSLNALAFTAIIMFIANPLNLYDVGFQMSFLAVLAILVFCKPLVALAPSHEDILSVTGRGGKTAEVWWKKALSGMWKKTLKWLWVMVVVSCCAQLGVAPLTAYYFGRFSTYFLLTNFFVIPLATVILYLTALMFVSALVPPLLPWVAKALAVVVGWQNGLAKGVASLPGSSIEGISLSRLQLLMIYVIIIAAATIVYKVLRLKNKI